MSADALLAELESPRPDPWSRTPPLPPARVASPHLPGPRSLNYTHEDCIDFIIQNPAVTQNALAQRYGYTPTWISLVINSDAFQAALAKRRDEVLSPELRASVEERFKALVQKSQDILLEKLHAQPTAGLALGVLNTASKALGYGARDAAAPVNNIFVVALPAQAESSEAWTRGRTIEHDPSGRSLPGRSDLPLPSPSSPSEGKP